MGRKEEQQDWWAEMDWRRELVSGLGDGAMAVPFIPSETGFVDLAVGVGVHRNSV